jgi:squalene-hopene/tetraprenyl-beta-curcumene cyclase
VPPSDPFVAESLAYLESLVNPQEGHIAGKDPKNQLKNYVTSVNIMAFAAADQALVAAGQPPRFKNLVQNGARYLKELQWDEGEGVTAKDPRYGGCGYDSKNRPDLSNTHFTLSAFEAAGVPKGDPHLQNAMVFVSRCQNFKSEHNDQAWAAKVNDGGFIYTPVDGGESKAGGSPEEGLVSYGSMTYAAVKSMIYAGVDRKDKRVQAALEWIRKNYTVDENPGMPKDRRQYGLYYYYHTMAKCLDALVDDYVVDVQQAKHDWRKDLTDALAKRQKPNGSWVNEQDRWMEGDPHLTTGYALLTLSYCKAKD